MKPENKHAKFATNSHMISAAMEIACEGVPILEGPDLLNPYYCNNGGPETLTPSKAVQQEQESQLEELMRPISKK